jgi:hypothetical protein
MVQRPGANKRDTRILEDPLEQVFVSSQADARRRSCNTDTASHFVLQTDRDGHFRIGRSRQIHTGMQYEIEWQQRSEQQFDTTSVLPEPRPLVSSAVGILTKPDRLMPSPLSALR